MNSHFYIQTVVLLLLQGAIVNSLRINNQKLSLIPSLSRRVLGIAIGTCLSFNEFQYSNMLNFQPPSVVADSTGKMSTKLTAKRRYIPRIKNGVLQFNNAAKDNSLWKVFVNDELPPLKRAMGLYGASLRKGEVPDEISRQADLLSNSFASTVVKLSSISDPAEIRLNIESSRAALDAYLSFAKLSTTLSDEYLTSTPEL